MKFKFIFRYLIAIFLVFIYFFPVYIRVLPSFMNSRILVFLMGIICLLFKKKVGAVVGLRNLKKYNLYIIAVFIISLTTSLINDAYEKQFLTYPLTYIIIVVSCYGLLYVIKSLGFSLNDRTLISIFTGVLVLESFLSILFFFFPAISDIYYSIVELRGLEEETVNAVLGSANVNRFTGVGINFFGAGIAYALSLFFICVRFLSETSNKEKVLYFLSFVLLVVVGSAISRTSQVGIVVGIGLLFFYYIFKKAKSFFSVRTFLLFLIIILLVYTFVSLYMKYVDNNVLLESVSRHAFEAFYRFFEEGRFYTTSSDKLAAGYFWPDTFKTWLIGDGRLRGITTDYYLGTDIGWCRLVFYFGIVGTIFFLLSQWWLFKNMCINKTARLFVLILLCLFLLKGLTDLIVYVMPFVIANNENKKLRACTI